jgi:hypothetical protein
LFGKVTFWSKLLVTAQTFKFLLNSAKLFVINKNVFVVYSKDFIYSGLWFRERLKAGRN